MIKAIIKDVNTVATLYTGHGPLVSPQEDGQDG